MNISRPEFKVDCLLMLQSMQTGHLRRVLPCKEDYLDSIWNSCERRIKQGDAEESRRVNEKDIQDKYPTCPLNGLEIMIKYESGLVDNLTNAMYAALVVSIWSEMEFLLKRMIKLCRHIMKRKGKTSGHFDKVKKFFQNDLSIDLNKISGFAQVDAIRILNNSFKHSNGEYCPIEKQPHTHIHRVVKDAWGIKEGERIRYSELDIKELVSECNTFCDELLDIIQSHPNVISASEEMV